MTRLGRRWLPVLVALLAWAPGSLSEDADARSRSLEYQEKAAEARERHDWPAFLENSRLAPALCPGDPRLTYALDCGS